MDEFFNVRHLECLVREGNLDQAYCYLYRFLPYQPQSMSIQAVTLLCFVHTHRFFAKIVAGKHHQIMPDKYKQYQRQSSGYTHADLRIRAITLSVLCDTIRASLDWKKLPSCEETRETAKPSSQAMLKTGGSEEVGKPCPNKHQMEESTSIEKGPDPKRQIKTGAFDEGNQLN
uniref:Uncharacterized protein n=1 Tax=Leersia perrieri TaxID=77586 RepID=A0A0D9VBX8_9ORYZ